MFLDKYRHLHCCGHFQADASAHEDIVVAAIQSTEGCGVCLLLIYGTLVKHALVILEEGLVAETARQLRDNVAL